MTIDDLIHRVVDDADRPLCEGPPVSLTKEQQEVVDKVLATLPLPPSIPVDPVDGGGVSNEHHRLVPC